MITKKLPLPKNQASFILHTLLNKKGLTERESGFNSYRTRISELINDYGAPIRARRIAFTNRFKRPSHCNEHYIDKQDYPLAVEVYFKINKSGA